MKPGLFLFIAFATILSGHSLSAQTPKGLVRGRVLDTAGLIPLCNAGILLRALTKDNGAIKTFSNDKGEFSINGLSPLDSFQLSISYIGYQSYQRSLCLCGKPGLDLGDIILHPSVKILDTVLFGISPVVTKHDTIEFNAAMFKTRHNAIIEELLQKLPGLQIDIKGKITYNGKPINSVLIDGKEYFGGDVLIATRNLPADIISKIQLIDTKTPQDAFNHVPSNGDSKTLNIKLKKDINRFFGYTTTGAGSEKHYELAGMGNYFNGPEQWSVVGSSNNLNKGSSSPEAGLDIGNPGSGITNGKKLGLNYNNDWGKRIKVSGNYTIDHLNTTNQTTTYRRQTITGDSAIYTTATNAQEDKGTYQNADLSFTYTPDTLNTIAIKGNYRTNESQSKSAQYMLTSLARGDTLNKSRQDVVTQSNSTIYMLDVFWGHTLKKGRSFTWGMNISQGTPGNTIGNLSHNSFYHRNIADSLGVLHQKLSSSSIIKAFSTGITYTVPINPLLRIMATGDISISNSIMDKINYQTDIAGGPMQLDTSASGIFTSHNLSTTTSISLLYESEKWKGSMGLASLYSKITNSYPSAVKVTSPLTQMNYTPQLDLQYTVTPGKSLHFTYSASTRQPMPEQLQPLPDNSNPLLIKLGNPGLHNSFSQSYSLSYSQFHGLQNLNAALYYNPINCKIVNAVFYDSVGRQVTKYINVNGIYETGGSLNYSITWKKVSQSFRLNPSFNITDSHDRSPVNNQTLIATTVAIKPSIDMLYSYKELLSVQCNYSLTNNAVRYQPAANPSVQYTLQELTNSIAVYLPRGLRLLSVLDYTSNTNVPTGFKRSALLWNLGVGKSMLKKQQLQIKLLIYDLLRQQNNVYTATSINYVETSKAIILKQYALLNISYSFKYK